MSSHRSILTLTAAKHFSTEDQRVDFGTVKVRVRGHAVNNTPEHASAAVLVCSRVLLQGVGGRFQLVNQVRIEDVEFVTLHNLSYTAKRTDSLMLDLDQSMKSEPKRHDKLHCNYSKLSCLWHKVYM